MDLTITEQELEKEEEKIERGLEGFRAVGNALMKIRDKQLYKNTYKNFEDYCLGRWGFGASNGYHLIAAASVANDLDEDVGAAKASHVSKLAIIKDTSLRQTAWNELNLGKVTGDKANRIAKKYAVIQAGGKLGERVENNELLGATAYDVAKKLQKLPPYYKIAVDKFGFKKDAIIGVEALETLRILEFAFEDEALDILRSGYLDDGTTQIALCDLTKTDIERYHKRLGWVKQQARLFEAGKVQQKQAKDVAIVQGTELSMLPAGRFAFAFPTDLYTPLQVGRILEGQGYGILFVAIYDRNNEPDILFGDNTRVKPSSINGVTPSWIMEMAQKAM